MELEAALARLARSNLKPAAKRQVEALLRAAADPDAGSADRLLVASDEATAIAIQAVADTMANRTSAVLGRAASELNALSDTEWQRLVEEAAEDDGA